MISRWELYNFKSIRNKTEIDLAPLTIFAGANSSGKSTLIQSILLVSQTLGNKVNSSSVVLNGDYIHLGQFDDLKSYDSQNSFITIGWTYTPTLGKDTIIMNGVSHEVYDLGDTHARTWLFGSTTNDLLSDISCSFSIDVNGNASDIKLLQFQPLLKSFHLSVSFDDGKPSLSIDSTREFNSKTARIELDSNSQDGLQKLWMFSQISRWTGRHFLPNRLYTSVDLCHACTQLILMALNDRLDDEDALSYLYATRVDVPCAARDIISNIFESVPDICKMLNIYKSSTRVSHKPLKLSTLLKRLSRLSSSLKERVNDIAIHHADLENILEIAFQGEIEQKDFEAEILLPDALSGAVDFIDDFFSRFVRYLGPLRDKPQAIYPVLHSRDPKDVGLRGEYTAAVLDLHRDTIINYIPSSAFLHPDETPVVIKSKLSEAVADWIAYLGIARDIETTNRGKIGYELKVSMSESQPSIDLTHVGVGVSQVLPILVTCLLSDFDTTLIFEQPELHLHPKVQTLLGDFFLSMTKLGKQCIVETHSEYLINRLRYRAASALDDSLWLPSMKVYFAEKSPSDGSTTFRDVNINEYGAINDWPDGFFDQTPYECDRILMAALAKRKAKHGNK